MAGEAISSLAGLLASAPLPGRLVIPSVWLWRDYFDGTDDIGDEYERDHEEGESSPAEMARHSKPRSPDTLRLMVAAMVSLDPETQRLVMDIERRLEQEGVHYV